MTDRYPSQPRYRAVMVVVLALGMAGVALSYAFVTPTPPPPGRVSIVQYIDDLGPVWPVVFGLTAVALLAAVATHRFYIPVLSAGGALFFAFATALFIGSFASVPVGPLVAGSLSLVAAVTCWVTAAAYSRSRW